MHRLHAQIGTCFHLGLLEVIFMIFLPSFTQRAVRQISIVFITFIKTKRKWIGGARNTSPLATKTTFVIFNFLADFCDNFCVLRTSRSLFHRFDPFIRTIPRVSLMRHIISDNRSPRLSFVMLLFLHRSISLPFKGFSQGFAPERLVLLELIS